MIETRRLLLRPPAEADVPAIVEGLSNFNVSRNTGRIPFPYAEQDARDYLAWVAEAAPGALMLAITAKPGSLMIGGIGLQIDPQHPTPELGYWLAEPYWGKGYGREAALSVVRQAFANTDVEMLRASYHTGNEASRRILEGMGFVFERVGPSPSKAQGREVETVFMSLARGQWEARRTAPI